MPMYLLSWHSLSAIISCVVQVFVLKLHSNHQKSGKKEEEEEEEDTYE
jgi:hypothetical protein